MLTEQQKDRKALLIAATVVEAIDAAGSLGTPAGSLYAALMPHGCELGQFDSLMATLVSVGVVTERGHLYYATERGRALVRGAARVAV